MSIWRIELQSLPCKGSVLTIRRYRLFLFSYYIMFLNKKQKDKAILIVLSYFLSGRNLNQIHLIFYLLMLPCYLNLSKNVSTSTGVCVPIILNDILTEYAFSSIWLFTITDVMNEQNRIRNIVNNHIRNLFDGLNI